MVRIATVHILQFFRGGFQSIRFFVSFLLQVCKYLLLLGTCRNLLDTYRLIDYVRNKRNMLVPHFRILRGWRCQTFSTNNITSCVCFWVPNPRILGSTWCSPATTKSMGWCDLPANVCISIHGVSYITINKSWTILLLEIFGEIRLKYHHH